MSRSTQFIGHTKEVGDFLRSCSIIRSVGTVTGMFDEEVSTLSDWSDSNDHVWREFIQYEPWSSGPMIFLGIKNLMTREIKGWITKRSRTYMESDFDKELGIIYGLS